MWCTSEGAWLLRWRKSQSQSMKQQDSVFQAKRACWRSPPSKHELLERGSPGRLQTAINWPIQGSAHRIDQRLLGSLKLTGKKDQTCRLQSCNLFAASSACTWMIFRPHRGPHEVRMRPGLKLSQRPEGCVGQRWSTRPVIVVANTWMEQLLRLNLLRSGTGL